MNNVVLTTIIPLFSIMLAGYLAARFRLLLQGSSEILSRFVFVVVLPALVIVSLSRVPVRDFFNWPFLSVLGGGMFITFCIGLVVARWFFKASSVSMSLHGLTSMYSSTGYIGLPVILLVFGEQELVPGIIGAVITGAVFFPLAIIVAELSESHSKANVIRKPLITIISNPVVLATAAGLSISALGLTLPAAGITFFELLGGAYIPCALFSAGLFIAGCSVKGEMSEIGWLVIVKLFLHPVITWWLGYRVFELEGALPAIAVLQAALPCGVPVFVLAQQYNVFVVRSSAVIVISTAISVLTLSVLLIYI